MERINQFSFYKLGQSFKALDVASHYESEGKVPAIKIFFEALTADSQISALLVGKPIPIGISKSSAEKLQYALREFISKNFEKEQDGKKEILYPKDDQKISKWELRHIIDHHLSTFETVFSEEMKEAATYFVPRRGIYHTPALVDNADETFPNEIAQIVPEKTRQDWKAAGRCLAFGLYSASGFHVARAVEGTIESYYQIFCNKPGKTLKSWHQYHEALKESGTSGQSPAPSEKVLTEISQMKDDYRNPIVHPRIVLSESDARMLFANGESLIIAMLQEIKETQKSGIQGLLAIGPGVEAAE